MAKPANSISTVKLPGDTNARPIVPYYIGYSVNNNYVATLPQLTNDAEIIINKLNQTINGNKTFNGVTTFNSYIQLYDDNAGDNIEIAGYDCLYICHYNYQRSYY